MELARTNRAKALLEPSDWPVARVAERAGFCSLQPCTGGSCGA
ncbi:MAG: hypothetical protein V4759_10655 [Pseudomonadota bacterium]